MYPLHSAVTRNEYLDAASQPTTKKAKNEQVRDGKNADFVTLAINGVSKKRGIDLADSHNMQFMIVDV